MSNWNRIRITSRKCAKHVLTDVEGGAKERDWGADNGAGWLLYFNHLGIHGAKRTMKKRKSEANRKTWGVTSVVCVLFLILCARSLAAEPKTIAFLEEHTVAPGTPQTVGALYVVPPGRKAYISNMFCEIRSANDPGYSYILLVVFANTTIAGPATNTAGMNPLVCLNSDFITTKTSSPGFTLLPGNYIYALYGNSGNNMDFQMMSAFIFEDDL